MRRDEYKDDNTLMFTWSRERLDLYFNGGGAPCTKKVKKRVFQEVDFNIDSIEDESYALYINNEGISD